MLAALLLIASFGIVQAQRPAKVYTKADTLRGSIGKERAWWDIQFYDLHVEPNIGNKTIKGFVDISYSVVDKGQTMQIDLQQPLALDSAQDYTASKTTNLSFEREGNVYWIHFPKSAKKVRIKLSDCITKAFRKKLKTHHGMAV